jgi:hypothetical protein
LEEEGNYVGKSEGESRTRDRVLVKLLSPGEFRAFMEA